MSWGVGGGGRERDGESGRRRGGGCLVNEEQELGKAEGVVLAQNREHGERQRYIGGVWVHLGAVLQPPRRCTMLLCFATG